MKLRLRNLDRWLLHAERMIALLERCRPVNAVDQMRRVLAAWQGGRRVAPAFAYAPAPDLSQLRVALEQLIEQVEPASPWGQLYAERAQELLLEAGIVEALGTPALRARALRRFPVGDRSQWRRAEQLAQRWCEEAPPPGEAPTHLSDDERDPLSLISAMRRAIGKRRLPFLVTVSAGLASAAATGDGVIAVRAGLRLRAADAQRVALHEVDGHALPRHRAQGEALGLFRVGTAGGGADEEGRALLLERRSGLMDGHRRAELGRRHLAALAVRAGASFAEMVDRLRELGAGLGDALQIAARCHRGGGLAREIVYLTALQRVQSAFAADPQLEPWLERGRIGLDAAVRLRQLGDVPETA